MLTLRETLVRAKDLISDPTKWGQGDMAKNQYGMYEPSESPDAVCFCAAGAAQRIARLEDGRFGAIDFLHTVAEQHYGFDSIGEFNDDLERTHEEMMRFFDVAIELAENKP